MCQYGITTQNKNISIFTATRTSNLTTGKIYKGLTDLRHLELSWLWCIVPSRLFLSYLCGSSISIQNSEALIFENYTNLIKKSFEIVHVPLHTRNICLNFPHPAGFPSSAFLHHLLYIIKFQNDWWVIMTGMEAVVTYFTCCPSICMKGLKKNRNLDYDSWSPCWDPNPGCRKYEVVVEATRPQYFVEFIMKFWYICTEHTHMHTHISFIKFLEIFCFQEK